VVVRERHAVDAQLGEALCGNRRRAKEERLARHLDRRAAVGHAALQVDHEQIGRARDLRQRRMHQRRPRIALQSLRHAATEHRVPGQGERHRHRHPTVRLARSRVIRDVRRAERSIRGSTVTPTATQPGVVEPALFH
jgi:hypothetical protein